MTRNESMSRRKKNAHRLRSQRRSLLMETLESRAMMATITWDRGAGTNAWGTATNWSGDTLPGAGDDVVFPNIGAAALTVDLGAVTRSVRSVTFTNSTAAVTYTLSNGTLSTTNDVIVDPTATQNVTISAVVAGAGGIVKTGGSATQQLTLSGNNTYTGVTTLNRGVLAISNANALGATSGGTVLNGNDGTTSSILDLTAGANTTYAAEPITINTAAGTGPTPTQGRVSVRANSNFTHTLQSPTTITGDTNLVQYIRNSGTFNVTGDITGTFSNGALLFVRGAAGTGSITGSVNLTGGNFAKTDGGTWTIGAAGKTYSWPATQIAVGTLRMTADNVLPASGTITIGQDGSVPVLDLNNTAQTTTGITEVAGAARQITSSVATAKAFTINTAAGFTFGGNGGIFMGNLNLVKQGAGTLILTSTNTYTGTTTVNAGTLQIGNNGTTGVLAGASNITVNSPAKLVYDRSNGVTYTNKISGNGEVRYIRGTPTVSPAVASDYSGTTFIENAVVTAGNNNTPFGTSAITMGRTTGGTLPTTRLNVNGATLPNNFTIEQTDPTGGNGTITGPGTLSGSLTANYATTTGGHLNGGTGLTLSGVVSTATGVVLNQRAGTVIFANAGNTFDSFLQTGTTKIGVNNGLPVDANIQLAAAGAGTLDLNGFNQTTTNSINRTTGSTQTTIITNSTVTPSTLTYNTTTDISYPGTFTGTADALNIVKNNTNVLTLTNNGSTVEGDITINNGIIRATAGNNNAAPVNSALGRPALAGGRSITVNSPGKLQFSVNDVMGNAGSTPTITIALVGGTLENSNGTAFNFFNTLGPITLNGGTINALGGSAANTFEAFRLRGDITVTGSSPSTLNSSGTNSAFHLHAGTVFNVADVTGNANADLIINGKVTNQTNTQTLAAGSFVKNGAGTLALANNINNFTGAITVNAGAVRGTIGNNTATPTTSVFGNPTTVGRNITVNSGGKVQFSNDNILGNAGYNPVVSFTVEAGGVVENTGNFFNTLGPINLNGGTLNSIGGNSAGFQSWRLVGPVTVGGTLPSTISTSGTNSAVHLHSSTTFNVADVTGNASPDLIISGKLINQTTTQGSAAAALEKDGAGTLSLSNISNTLNGAVTVNNGVLLGATGNNAVNPAGTVFGNPNTATRVFTVNAPGKLQFGADHILGNAGSTPGVTVVATGGTIENTGNFFNTLGNVTLNGGTLNSVGGNSVNNFEAWYITGNVTVGGTSASAITASGTNSRVHLGTSTTFNVANATGDATPDLIVSSGLINQTATQALGAASLVKTGTGSLSIPVNTNYTGTTSVNNGALILGGTQATSGITVNINGAVGGTSISAPIIINDGGRIDPATNVGLQDGTLSVSNTITFSNGAIFAPQLMTPANSDLLTMTSNGIDLTGVDLVASTISGYTQGTGTYTILSTPGGALTGTFNGIPENVAGTTISVSGQKFKLFYNRTASPPTVTLVDQNEFANTVYVNNDWEFTTLGADPDGASNGVTAEFGFTAFADIQSAINAVADNGTIVIEGGVYTDTVNLNKAGITFQFIVDTVVGQSTQDIVHVNGAVTLPNAPAFSNSSFPLADASFGSTIDGAVPLNFSGTTADITLNGAVGSITPPTSLTTSDTSSITRIGANITTVGAQFYNVPVELTNDIIFATTTNGSVTFDETLDADLSVNNRTVTVNANGTGDLDFNGAVGSTGNLKGLILTARSVDTLPTAAIHMTTAGSTGINVTVVANSIFDGQIHGSGGITKEGAGNLTLTNANTYDGLTSINHGRIYITNGDALGSSVSGTIVNSNSAIVGGTGPALYLQNNITVNGET